MEGRASCHGRKVEAVRIGIYKDTLANRRGADFAVLALAAGLRERGHDAVVFEKPCFEERIAEHWNVVISTGTNELLDIYNCFSGRPARTAPIPVSTPARASPLATRFARWICFPFPIIQQFHTSPKSQLKWKRFVRNWRIKKALRHVDAIQVLSESFIPQVAKYDVPVHVIGNWSEMRVRTLENGSDLFSNVVICPAALAKGKNQKLLIAAFARIAAEFPDWKLRLLGRVDGGYADECRRLAAKSGFADRIEFAGFCDDLAEEYQTCAFVAFPSVDEGFGLVIADAAAFAKPCVTVRDWIGAASAGGGIVASPTVSSYADGLRMMMADVELRRRMGAAAQRFCAATYSRERILDKWDALLFEVVAAAHG